MTQETTLFLARTAKGAVIEQFDCRELAMKWVAEKGDRFPGWEICLQTRVEVIKTRVVRRDRPQLEEVA